MKKLLTIIGAGLIACALSLPLRVLFADSQVSEQQVLAAWTVGVSGVIMVLSHNFYSE